MDEGAGWIGPMFILKINHSMDWLNEIEGISGTGKNTLCFGEAMGGD
jgi:hypothetical protein